MVESVDWSKLTQDPETFIDPELRKAESDLLYQVPRLDGDGTVYLYLLFEHQRLRDYRMAYRLLNYMMRIWARWLAANGRRSKKPRLPLIVPMVLYNGAKRWTVSTASVDLFEHDAVFEALRAHVPAFEYVVLDLSQIPDEAIRGAAMGRMIQLLMKWADKDDFWERLPGWLHTMRSILQQPELGMDAIEAMLRYIMRVSVAPPPDTIRPQLRHFLTPQSEEMVMTWAEQLRQQGLEQGIEQGLEQGRHSALQEQQQRAAARVSRMLRLKFGDVSEAVEQQVAAATLDALERWTERILIADTIGAVFAEG